MAVFRVERNKGYMPGFAKLPQKKNAAILKKRLQRSLNLIQF